MKRLLSLLLLLAFVLGISSCEKQNTDESDENRSEVYYEALKLINENKLEEAYSVLYEKSSDADAQRLLTNFKVVYTSYTETYSDGSLLRRTYEYDENGALVKENYDATSSDGTRYASTTTYTLDEKGRAATSHYHQTEGGPGYNNDSDTAYTYDDAGNLIKEEITYEHGNVFTYEYTYDDKGNMVRLTRASTYDGIYNASDHTYDNNGNIVSTVLTMREGDTYTETFANTYDDRNRLTKVVGKDENMILFECDYIYDQNGNLIKQVYTNEGDNYRTVEYSGYLYFYNN